MKNVLFIGVTRYDLKQEDSILKNKFERLSCGVNVFVIARGDFGHFKKYNCDFYLVPKKIGLFFWSIVVFFWSLFLIKNKKIDIIIAQSPSFEGVISVLLKKITKIKLIIEVHGDWIESPFLYHKFKFENIIKKILVSFGKFSLKNANKIRVISSSTDNLVYEISSRKGDFIFPTFTDVDLFLKENDISWENRILYVGVLYRLKGVHFLLKAFKKIQDKHFDFKLILIGDGPYKKELVDLIEKENIKNVEFLGKLNAEDVRDQMKICNVLVLPSLSEGLGRVLIEAGALSKPLIGTNIGGIPDIIKDNENGFLFESANVDDLAEKLDLLISDLDKSKEFGQKSRKFIENKFSTENYFSSFFKMINSL